jgi:hypothetical protein
MKKIRRGFLLGSVVFGFQMLYMFFWSLHKSFDLITALKSTFSIVVYTLVYASWAYFLFSYIFIVATKRTKEYRKKVLIAGLLMIISYFLFRGGDIIDGDFLRKFDILFLIGFLLTAPVMVFSDNILVSKQSASG